MTQLPAASPRADVRPNTVVVVLAPSAGSWSR
jgi:hypothetical protein